MSCEVRELVASAIHLFSCEVLCIHKETALTYIMFIDLSYYNAHCMITGKVK